jgi:hypothetical protein
MRILLNISILFFFTVSVACSHGPKVSTHFKEIRQKRQIATTGIVSWAQDVLVETSASNAEAVAVKLKNLKRELAYVEKYSIMFISGSEIDAFREALFVLGPFLKKYEQIWKFADAESRVLHSQKFNWVLNEAAEQIDISAFHMQINDIVPDLHLLKELIRVNKRLSTAYDRLELELSFESKYVNLSRASELAEAEVKKHRSWFSW